MTGLRNTSAALVGALALMLIVSCVSSESTVRRFEPSDDDAAATNYQLGVRYYQNGSYELARDRLDRAIEIDSRMAEAYSLLALTYVALGNQRLATQNFNSAVRIAPGNYDVRNAYAVFLCRQREYDDALAQFDRAIRGRENDTPWIMMTNAGVCIAGKPDLARAEQYFRDALQRRPSHGEALLQMAALKHRTGDDLNARAFLQRYLAVGEESAGVLYLAVQIETKLGDQRAATDYTNRLLDNFPDSQEAGLLRGSGS